MAINTELRVSNGTTFSGSEQLVYMRSHYKYIDGLKDSNNIILSDLLPYANVSNGATGKVKLSKIYNPTTPDNSTALAQEGAKDMYETLYAKIQNLESPLDYLTSFSVNWTGTVNKTTINSIIETNVEGLHDGLRPGHAVLINNTGSCEFMSNYDGVPFTVEGYWLWVRDSNGNWNPSIDFPEVPSANYNGTTEEEMVEGIITKAMLFKLKNIEAGAQVNTVISVAGKTGEVTLTKSDVGLGNVDNTADNAKEVLSATKLKVARKIAGVSFDGTADIGIPFNNLSNIPQASISEEGVIKIFDPVGKDFTGDLTPYYNQAVEVNTVKRMIDTLAKIPIVSSLAEANALPQASIAGSLVLIQLP